MYPDKTQQEASIWFDLFPESSRQLVHAGQTLFRTGDPVDHVILIESGAVAEVRQDDGVTHASCLCHAGMLVGVRWSGFGSFVHATEAVALVETTIRSIPLDTFTRANREDGRYAHMMLADMAKRVDSARRLTDCLAQNSARDHVLSVLRAIAEEFGSDQHGHSQIAIPAHLLQRLTGCPRSTLGSAINDLMINGVVHADLRGIQLIGRI
ncbi:MAG: Crp/Fnr family transcriptional regulator [Candidatus Kapabacteria bacterium]|nr:Crp/Fnr family transcriptional regulator [Candidatus Kapabacteria bacterium]